MINLYILYNHQEISLLNFLGLVSSWVSWCAYFRGFLSSWVNFFLVGQIWYYVYQSFFPHRSNTFSCGSNIFSCGSWFNFLWQNCSRVVECVSCWSDFSSRGSKFFWGEKISAVLSSVTFFVKGQNAAFVVLSELFR